MASNNIKKAFNNSNKRFQAIMWTVVFDEYEWLRAQTNKKSSDHSDIKFVDGSTALAKKPSTIENDETEAAALPESVPTIQAAANADPKLSSTSNDVSLAIQDESTVNQKELLSPLTISTVSKSPPSNLHCAASKHVGTFFFKHENMNDKEHPFHKISKYLNISVDDIKVKIL